MRVESHPESGSKNFFLKKMGKQQLTSVDADVAEEAGVLVLKALHAGPAAAVTVTVTVTVKITVTVIVTAQSAQSQSQHSQHSHSHTASQSHHSHSTFMPGPPQQSPVECSV